ncbi:hypothetical protein Tco_0243412 [Tanacetum coccineum]
MVTCWQKCGSTKDKPYLLNLLLFEFKVVKFSKAKGVEEVKKKVQDKGVKRKKSILHLGRNRASKYYNVKNITKMIADIDMTDIMDLVDPPGFEGYLKMEVKVPDSSCLKDS